MKTNGSGNVLVVDDNDFVLMAVTLLLRSHGFKVTDCASAEDAIARLGAAGFDAVLTDLRLPKMSGLELMEKVRETDARLPVILMTAYTSPALAQLAAQKGAFDLILKPSMPKFIVERVKNAVSHYRGVQGNP